MTFLVDPNVISEMRRRSPDPAVVAWVAAVDAEDLYISVLTIGKICRGIEQLRRKDQRAADHLDDWRAGLTSAYGDRIVPVDEAVAGRWARIGLPDRLPVIDGLLAATALVRDWTLVPRNASDVARSGAKTLSPWAAAS